MYILLHVKSKQAKPSLALKNIKFKMIHTIQIKYKSDGIIAD